MYPFPGPVPPYNNPPIMPLNFRPREFFISAISLGQTTTITTTVNHNYVIGNLIRLLIPVGFGSRGLNEVTGYVIAVPAPNQVTTNISSLGIDPFKPNVFTTQPQIVAVGDINTGAINANGPANTRPFIDGSFRNISN
jgi:hypothetical protein